MADLTCGFELLVLFLFDENSLANLGVKHLIFLSMISIHFLMKTTAFLILGISKSSWAFDLRILIAVLYIWPTVRFTCLTSRFLRKDHTECLLLTRNVTATAVSGSSNITLIAGNVRGVMKGGNTATGRTPGGTSPRAWVAVGVPEFGAAPPPAAPGWGCPTGVWPTGTFKKNKLLFALHI